MERAASDGRPKTRLCPVDLLDPAVRASPYDAYRLLRETAPVCRAGFGPWIVSRHADAQWLLESGACERWGQNRDSRRSASPVETAIGESLRLLGPSGSEPVRRVVADALGATRLKGLDANLAEMADRLIRDARPASRLDVIAGFAAPLTFLGVRRILGVTGTVGDRIEEAVVALGGDFFASLMLPGVPPIPRAASALTSDLLRLVREARRERSGSVDRGTLVRRLAAVAPDVGDTELVNLLLLIIFASYHNMAAFIGNAVLALAMQPDAAAPLCGQSLPIAAVMELLRFDPPLQFLAVTATSPMRLHDQSIDAGDAILVAIGAANRDPSVFPHPDQLDFARDGRAQLSFGVGAWRCLGARLAQSIARVALERLLAAIGLPRLAAAPVWQLDGPMVQRGMKTLSIDVADD